MNKHIDKIFIIWITLFFIGDLLSKVSNLYLDGNFYRINGFLKLGFELVLLYYFVTNFRRKKILLYPISFLLLFVIGQFSFGNSLASFFTGWSSGNIYFLNRFLYIFLFIVVVQSIELKKDTFPKILNILEKILIINGFLILLGFFFDLNIFKTYPSTIRFGYNGLFAKNGEVSYYYMFLISILYYNIIEKGNRDFVKLAFVIITSLLLGKKVMLLYLAILFLFHFLWINKHKNRNRLIASFFFIVVFYFRNNILNIIFNYSSFWDNIFKKNGLLGMITSTRSMLFERAIEHIGNEWNFINYLCGGIQYSKYKVEFEFIDVFLFFGVIGVILYILFLINYFFEKDNRNKNSLLVIILICSFFSGSLFLSVGCMIFLYITFKELGIKKLDK
ncbi:hypothetical protein [Algibacter sp. 2305UL17-15]|uniref:hypothetical protein n=1 Tax=Algibacter sp. 2305UL17-15 TaxID=3231268 RepID=UPI0034593006